MQKKYNSNAQRARVLTEHWLQENIYCPICENTCLNHFENNRPVADFYCSSCGGEYELKSKNGKLGNKIIDGAYDTMIERIGANNNPNFFFLIHKNWEVHNLLMIPNHFFVPSIIEKRKPLGINTKRAGWVGCNINLETIPECGKIFIIKDKVEVSREIVKGKYQQARALITENIASRGWLMDTLLCVEKIPFSDFTLNEVYKFVDDLQVKYPNNLHIKDKLRQQMQLLRGRGDC